MGSQAASREFHIAARRSFLDSDRSGGGWVREGLVTAGSEDRGAEVDCWGLPAGLPSARAWPRPQGQSPGGAWSPWFHPQVWAKMLAVTEHLSVKEKKSIWVMA